MFIVTVMCSAKQYQRIEITGCVCERWSVIQNTFTLKNYFRTDDNFQLVACWFGVLPHE